MSVPAVLIGWPLPAMGMGTLLAAVFTAVLTGKLQTGRQVDAVRRDYETQLQALRDDRRDQLDAQDAAAQRRESQLVAQSDAWKSAYFSETQVSRLSRQQLSELFELARLTEGTMRKAIEAQPPERSENV